MSTVAAPGHHFRSVAPRLSGARWVLLLVVALGEIIALTAATELPLSVERPQWASVLLRWTPLIGQLGILALAASLVCGGVSWIHSARTASDRFASNHDWAPRALVHLTAFAAFWWLTGHVVDPRLVEESYPGLWVTAWIVAGATAYLSLALAVLPAAGWLFLIASQRRSLLWGVALGIAAWRVGESVQSLWAPLAHATFAVVNTLLEWTGRQAVADPERLVVGTEEFSVRVAPMCSGIEGMGLMLVFVAAYLWLCRQRLRFPQAFLLIPLGLACVWIANALRITTLILIGDLGAPDLAVGGFPPQAVSLLFAATGLVVVFVGNRVWSVDAQAARGPSVFATPSAAYLLPMLVLLAAAMASGAVTTGFDDLYPARMGLVALVLWHYWSNCHGVKWTWSWWAPAIGIAVFALWWALEPTASVGLEDAPVMALASWSTWGAALWILSRVLGSVLLVPLVEELAFRGYLMRRLLRADFGAVSYRHWSWAALVITSTAFGMLHGHRWLAGTLAGLLLGLAAIRSGNLADAVIAHAVANACVAGLVLATGNWSMWL